MAKPTGVSDNIYQLKITLQRLQPPVWRRVLVPGKLNLYKLHQIIQQAMGWTDSHLHQFIVSDRFYSIPSPEDWQPVEDERRFTLQRLGLPVGGRFVYEYDFGDSWEHDILIEGIGAAEADRRYPVCLAGERACPPEDVGGVWGYADLLEALANPEHEEHDSYREWAGDDFDPEAFDLTAVNRALGRIR